ncbi:NAD(P)H-hydrate epimerase [Curtobacterium ammoniigenes]|uniref:NAD(P)H-hydrate epimerase n=1 Tax=Curtobacterium ammoniigenes TaxID=395387 RepID=UPI001FE055A0|nr:NAD(P)H-hydrate epimerase [Curtobacterium ammoniigenes]
MDGYTADQIRAAEAPHLAAGEPLMQRAADGLARIAERLLAAGGAPPPGRVLLLVGSGNNGGDTLYAGERLARAGRLVTIIRTGSRIHTAGLEAALAAGARLHPVSATAADPDAVRAAVTHVAASADLVLDGMLGIGITGSTALRGAARAAVEGVREAQRHREAGGGDEAGRLSAAQRRRGGPVVVAVDVPSGIDADTGAADDSVLQADVTVTFGGMKAGLLREPAASLSGHVELVDVGIGADLPSSAN